MRCTFCKFYRFERKKQKMVDKNRLMEYTKKNYSFKCVDRDGMQEFRIQRAVGRCETVWDLHEITLEQEAESVSRPSRFSPLWESALLDACERCRS